MKIVNIYIAINSKNTRKSAKKYGYVLELEGNPNTKEGFGEIDETYNKTTLKAINEALGRLNQPCKVRIHTENGFVTNMAKCYLENWASADFKTARGKTLENEQEWRKLWDFTQSHQLTMMRGTHNYTKRMKDQMADKTIKNSSSNHGFEKE